MLPNKSARAAHGGAAMQQALLSSADQQALPSNVEHSPSPGRVESFRAGGGGRCRCRWTVPTCCRWGKQEGVGLYERLLGCAALSHLAVPSKCQQPSRPVPSMVRCMAAHAMAAAARASWLSDSKAADLGCVGADISGRAASPDASGTVHYQWQLWQRQQLCMQASGNVTERGSGSCAGGCSHLWPRRLSPARPELLDNCHDLIQQAVLAISCSIAGCIDGQA